MTLRTITLSSELLALTGLSYLEDFGAYAVQQTPEEPNYWMGNQLIVKDADFPVLDTVPAFERHFPDAVHRSIVWDINGFAAEPIRTALVPLGFKVDAFDALTLNGKLAEAVTPDGVTLRALTGLTDWEQSYQLQCEVGQEDGYPADSHALFIARRNETRRRQIESGLGQWFGAFEGNLMVAQMGLMHDDAIARYQSVETRITHRKRGICAALLRHVGLWALDRAPEAKLVIVAEADGNAGRLYRRMGFAHSETIVGAVKSGY